MNVQEDKQKSLDDIDNYNQIYINKLTPTHEQVVPRSIPTLSPVTAAAIFNQFGQFQWGLVLYSFQFVTDFNL